MRNNSATGLVSWLGFTLLSFARVPLTFLSDFLLHSFQLLLQTGRRFANFFVSRPHTHKKSPQEYSALGWAASSAYWGGSFFKIANLYLLSFSYGIIYFGFAYLWSLYYNALNGNSVAQLASIAGTICYAGVLFSAIEQYIYNTLDQFANEQTMQQRAVLNNKIKNNIGYLHSTPNLGEQMVNSTANYYEKLHAFCVSCFLKAAGILGSLAFIWRFSLHLFTAKVLVCSIALNTIIYHFTSSTTNPNSISNMRKKTDNASNDLRKALGNLGERYEEYAGNVNLRNWAAYRIDRFTKNLQFHQRSLISANTWIEFTKSSLGRMIFPLIGIIIAWSLNLTFPLAQNLTINHLIDVGIFIQLMQAYMSMWRDSVVFLDKQRDLSQANSGYSNLSELCTIFGITPKDAASVQPSAPPNEQDAFLRHTLIATNLFYGCVWAMSCAGFSMAPVLGVTASFMTHTFFVHWAIVATCLSTALVMSTPSGHNSFFDNLDLNIFTFLTSGIVCFLLTLAALAYPTTLTFLSITTIEQAAVALLATFACLSYGLLQASLYALKPLQSLRASSLQPSVPARALQKAPMHSKPQKDAISYNRLTDPAQGDVIAQDLALSTADKNQTMSKKWQLDGKMTFQSGKAHLIQAPNSTGKSSTLRALLQDSQQQGECFHGSVSFPANHLTFCFHQRNNPLGRLPDLSVQDTFTTCNPSDAEPSSITLTPLQSIFMRYVLSNFSNPSSVDIRIWNRWATIRQSIIDFLDDSALNFDAQGKLGWLYNLRQDKVDTGMSGGACAKLNAAIIHAMLTVYSDLEKDDPNYQAPFLTVIIDEGFNDIATENQKRILEKLTEKVKKTPKAKLICVLHTDNQAIIRLYDTITLLQPSTQGATKNTPADHIYTHSTCLQFNNSDINQYFDQVTTDPILQAKPFN